MRFLIALIAFVSLSSNAMAHHVDVAVSCRENGKAIVERLMGKLGVSSTDKAALEAEFTAIQKDLAAGKVSQSAIDRINVLTKLIGSLGPAVHESGAQVQKDLNLQGKEQQVLSAVTQVTGGVMDFMATAMEIMTLQMNAKLSGKAIDSKKQDEIQKKLVTQITDMQQGAIILMGLGVNLQNAEDVAKALSKETKARFDAVVEVNSCIHAVKAFPKEAHDLL